MIKFHTDNLGISVAENQYEAIRASRPVDSEPVTSSGWYEYETKDGQRFFAHLQFKGGILITGSVVVKSAADAMRRDLAIQLGESATKKSVDAAIETWRLQQQ